MRPLPRAAGHASLPRMVRRFTRALPRDTFEKSVALRARHGRFGTPANPATHVAEVRKKMRAAEQAALGNGLPRPLWHFKAEEVESIDFDGNGQVIFCLRDGRTFDANGDPRVTLP